MEASRSSNTFPVENPTGNAALEVSAALLFPGRIAHSEGVITIGLTGGIASGKSEVGRLLVKRGAVHSDADRIAHESYAPGTDGFRQLVEAFGDSIVGVDGVIDRRRLGEIVFNQPERLQRLNDLVWPLARRRAEEVRAQEAAKGTRVLVIEAPLLLEAGWRDIVDVVWIVQAPPAAVRERLATRGLTPTEAEARIAARKLPSAADATVIENDGDLETLERRVDAAWEALLRGATE